MSGASRIASIAVLSLAATFARSSAAGEERRVRLEYERAAGAERCPDRAELAASVAAELGYDPFQADAKETLAVELRERDEELVAHITLEDEAGAAAGERELTSRGGDCRELAAALALALAIAIDPVRASRQGESAPAEKEPEPQPDPIVVAPVVPVPPHADARRPRPGSPAAPQLAGGALIAAGSAPAPATGIWLQAGARFSMLSLALEGQAHLPASRSVNGGSVSASLLLASALACFNVDPFFACAVGSGGALQGSGEGVTEPRKATTFFARAGARLGLDVPLDETLGLVVHAEVAGNLTRTTLELDGQEAWESPLVSGLLAGGMRARF
jgi:hypothetical protein